MKTSSVFLLGVILAAMALVLVGCLDYRTPGSGKGELATPASSATSDASGFSDGQGADSTASASSAATGATPSPAAAAQGTGSYADESAAADLESAGSDLDSLEVFSDDLSAGDIEYSEG